MSNSYLDYDYPCNETKPVYNTNSNSSTIINSQQRQQEQKQSSKPETRINQLTNGRLAPFPPINDGGNCNFVGTSANKQTRTFPRFKSTQNCTIEQRSIGLNTIVPIKKVDSSNGLVSNAACYYDVPKNIPVDSRFHVANNGTISKQPAQLFNHSNDNLSSARPNLPQKSSKVLNKMSTYTMNGSNLANGNNYTNFGSNKLDTQSGAKLSPVQKRIANKQESLILNKSDTSKRLPSLPSKQFVRQQRNEPIQQDYDMLPKPRQTNEVKNIGQVLPSTSNNDKNKNKLQYNNLLMNNDDDDDDDDDQCDYEYDYVCLESKKKLDQEDVNVKKAISKDLQTKFERLALNSIGLIDLQGLERSIVEQNKPSTLFRAQFLPSYKHYLTIALRNFENWISLSLEIIDRQHPPNVHMDVFINFTKHILLSGQNLLLVVKSFIHHCPQSNPRLTQFDNKFYEHLKLIVLKTKKAVGEQSNTKSIDEMVSAIKNALQFTNNLLVDFSQTFLINNNGSS